MYVDDVNNADGEEDDDNTQVEDDDGDIEKL